MRRLENFDPQTAIIAPSVTRSGGVLIVDLAAIQENYKRLQLKVGESVEVAAAVKADAYGLGVARVAPALYRAGCKRFFVATRDEALELRHILANATSRQDETPIIHLLNGLFDATDEAIREAEIRPVINSPEQLAFWTQNSKPGGSNIPCVLQFDSGMSRYGFSPSDVAQLAAHPALLRGLSIDFVMSHLAQADACKSATNYAQLAQFETMRAPWSQLRASLAASSGVYLGNDFHFDIVRPGYALYGGNPTPDQPNPMRNVVSLYARLIQMRDIPMGGLVGYGGAFCAQRSSRIATLAVGYADGLPRCAGGHIRVIHTACPDIALPVVGRISMDSLAVDITDLPAYINLHTQPFFEVLGPHQLLDIVAKEVGTIGYELLTSMGRRFHRVYLEEQS